MSVDPTRINIQVDPTEKRMRGVAYHGNTPFDVPYISELAEGLWQGGCETGLVLPKFIHHVVSLYPWERYIVKHELTSEVYVRLYDNLEGVALEQIEALARWINVCRQTGTVLVHCQAGLNRSSLVAATALILDGMSVDEAVALVREKRSPACLCNPSFEKHLKATYGSA